MTRFIGSLTVFHSTLSIEPIETVSVKYRNSQLTNQEPCPHILRYVITVLIWLGYHYHSHLYGFGYRQYLIVPFGTRRWHFKLVSSRHVHFG